jgi:hypothetical protein
VASTSLGAHTARARNSYQARGLIEVRHELYVKLVTASARAIPSSRYRYRGWRATLKWPVLRRVLWKAEKAQVVEVMLRTGRLQDRENARLIREHLSDAECVAVERCLC